MTEEKTLAKSVSNDRADLVAYWSIPLIDGAHIVEFEHGTTTGKRVLRIDGKEVFRKEWMFKLVGDIKFTLGNQEAKCELRVDPIPPFAFSYSLWVDGKPIDKFTEKQLESIKSWSVVASGKRYAVVFEKHTLEIWVNGQIVEVERKFVEDGTEMNFQLGNSNATIRCAPDQGHKEITYSLFVNDRLISDDISKNHNCTVTPV